MAERGGEVDFTAIKWFNGGLFNDDAALPLEAADIERLERAAGLDWSEIDPSILGTLFERGLDPDKRSQLGAHYTDREKIMRIVDPVVVRPLAAEWDAEKGEVAALLEKAEAAKAPSARTKARNEATAHLRAFLDRLRAFRVLDPACGSGNFLYLSLLALKDLEHRVMVEAEAFGFQREFVGVGPQAVLGIELNPYAAELARVSVWIGDIQWARRHGYTPEENPVLRKLDTIECRDALMEPDGREAAWPVAECIVGNPPFLGGKMMRRNLSNTEVERLFAAYEGRVPREADLVCYWFEKARAQIVAGRSRRAGLVATNSIRGGANRRVLDRVSDSGQTIFEAWADEPWMLDGAAVRVSLVCFGQPSGAAGRLNGREVQAINADLTGSGLDLTKARRLPQNRGVAFQGSKKVGPFEVAGETARVWLRSPINPNGRTNADVLRPSWIGVDAVRRDRDVWIIDFQGMSAEEAALYESPFQYILSSVKPLRDKNARASRRNKWWLHGDAQPKMRSAVALLPRFIVTPEVSKHRLFRWIERHVLPDCQLMVIVRHDDTTLGILHSRFHEAWALRLGTSLEDRPRYTPTTTFETFPFPDGLTPDLLAGFYTDDPRAQAIATAARRLHELRENWLNPPDQIRHEREVVPGFPDRVLPRDAAAARELTKRTLTALYNARPRWLADAHATLDAAVAAAYGWPAKISDEDAMARLLALNMERARPEVG